MARGTTATSHRDDQDNQPAEGFKTSKRRCIQSACVPCRKRKSKCDGGTPVCATCTAVYKTECHYDPESESRRSKAASSSSSASAGAKRDASVVAPSSAQSIPSNADFIITSIRTLPEEHVLDFIQFLRKDPELDIATLAESWRKIVALPPSTPVEIRSLESDLSLLLGKPAVTLTGESRHFGHTASLGLVPEEENFGGGRMRTNNVLPERQGTTWTTVTSDLQFIEKMFSLYFTWCHPFYVVFSRECFYKDFRAGREKYCSPLLVNAICAYGCHLTDDPAGRTDPSNSRTAGDHFFAEARRLLFEDETPSLTTVQALCVMAMREPSTARDSSGFGYMGRCIRMCVELGLHLKHDASPALGLTPSEIEVRKVTFWGCFTVDSVWSICMGRISQLPCAAITLEKPILEETTHIPEPFPGPSHVSPVITSRMFLQEFASLSELVNDNNYMFFAPKERLTSSRLLDCYNKYKAWYQRLPPSLSVEGKREPEPHILVLHMLYHTIIVHLFRPMLKVDLIHSDVHPRHICVEAANNVSRLTRIYRSMYSFRVAHLPIPHILLSVCIVHLLYSKDDKTSRQNLIEGLHGLEDLQECHYFAARSFQIIYSLARTWDLPWPRQLQNSRLVPKRKSDKNKGTSSPPADPLLVAPNTVTATTAHAASSISYPPIGHPQRRESLSMFAQGHQQVLTHLSSTRPSSIVPNAHHRSPTVSRGPTQATYSDGISLNTYQYSQSISSLAPASSTTATSPTVDAAETLFWNPIPGMQAPILPRTNYIQSSPMGVESLLHTTDMGDRLGRDGFKINQDWRSSQIGEYPPTSTNEMYGSPNEQSGGGYGSRDGINYSQPVEEVPYQQSNHDPHMGQTDYPSWWSGQHSNDDPKY